MAARKKADKAKVSKKKCVICGSPHDGRNGDVCAKCVGQTTSSTGEKRVAEQVRNRILSPERGGFICPYCQCELSWENIKTSEIEVTIYVREKIYFCPACRAFLGVSSWHTEG
jgi:hypothetical protein